MSGRLPFVELFLALRSGGVKVSLGEWMGLLEALAKDSVPPSLTDFYHVSRALLVKSEMQFDTFDQVFSAVFGEGDMRSLQGVKQELLEWLEQPIALRELSAEELEALEELPLERLRELLEQRLREQTERHDGGNRWIGTGGTSPFGHGGVNPAGIRIGGAGAGGRAVQIAAERRFRDLRSDRVLDTRAVAVALRRLRRLSRTDGDPELDVDESIDRTSRAAGELELAFRPPRRNEARVLLLMDTGGSMEPYTRLVETLFSAASHLHHWKKLEAFTFHNCPYQTLYSSIWGREGTPTAEILSERPKSTHLILVGDATMAPSELTARGGALDSWQRNDTPGIVWLHRLRTRFPRAVWLNPTRPEWWRGWTCQVIGQLFPMFPLSLAGLDEAVDFLLKRTVPPVPELDAQMLRFDPRMMF
jgi:uncharacterized protein